ncbi:MAG: hypothetical protein CL782_06215 [Chloroflexi bacterium]|nr:hypothetical protein [Chloroflexota bacterium]|tara:strand:- start:171356 stop:171871 length:516 start_codon:yes stop_codon:yes gene_type:complete
MDILFTIFETELGWIGLEKTNHGISLVTFPQKSKSKCKSLIGTVNKISNKSCSELSYIKDQISLYASGVKVDFSSVKLDYTGHTKFSKKTLEACRDVPFGERRNYKWLANQSGSAFAYRAVGQIMAKNKFPIIVPCHRIVGSTGKLTGFRGKNNDLDMKMKFLNLEQNIKT